MKSFILNYCKPFYCGRHWMSWHIKSDFISFKTLGGLEEFFKDFYTSQSFSWKSGSVAILFSTKIMCDRNLSPYRERKLHWKKVKKNKNNNNKDSSFAPHKNKTRSAWLDTREMSFRDWYCQVGFNWSSSLSP